jgi:hypothetical protein
MTGREYKFYGPSYGKFLSDAIHIHTYISLSIMLQHSHKEEFRYFIPSNTIQGQFHSESGRCNKGCTGYVI